MFRQMFQHKTSVTTAQVTPIDQLFYQAVQQQEPMIVFTPQGEIVDANALFLSAVGYAKSEILGQHHRIFCAADYARSIEYQRSGKPWHGVKLRPGLLADIKKR